MRTRRALALAAVLLAYLAVDALRALSDFQDPHGWEET